MSAATSTLEDIEFLARSPYRIQVLEQIRTEPRRRPEFRELTDASRVTIGRILTDFEERELIERTGSEYVATDRGAFLADEFVRLVSNVKILDRLPNILDWFPGDQPTFDLRFLADATVIVADERDILGPIRRGLDHIKRTDQLDLVANSAAAEFIEELLAAVRSGRTNTLLLPPETIEALQLDPDLRQQVREMIGSGRTTLLRYDGDGKPPVFQVGDGTVALCSRDHRAVIETDDPRVYEWAVSYFDSLRAESTPVSAESFADEPTEVERNLVTK